MVIAGWLRGQAVKQKEHEGGYCPLSEAKEVNQSSDWGEKEKILNPLKERIYKIWSQDSIQGVKLRKLPSGLSRGPFIMLPVPSSITFPTNSHLSTISIPVRMRCAFCVFKNVITSTYKFSLFFLTPFCSINLIITLLGRFSEFHFAINVITLLVKRHVTTTTLALITL